MPKTVFQPRLIPGIAALATVALFVSLGQWQSGKAQRRSAEIEQHQARSQQGAWRLGAALVDAQEVQDMPVTVRGTYEAQKQFFIDNRQENGKPGLHVITPLKLQDSEVRILVNRGWVGWGVSRGNIPTVEVPAGTVEVTGLAAIPSTKKFFLMPAHEDSNPRLWTRLDLSRFEATYPGALQPVVVLQNPDDAQDTLVRKWPPPEDRVAMHKSYALQWYGMAVALIIFYLVASLRKKESA